jgi:hypothetical protein
LAKLISINSGERGRVPAWVTRIRSLLRFMDFLSRCPAV